MKKILSDIYRGLSGSIENKPGGYSSKKLTALAITICIVAAHVKWWHGKDFTLLPTILGLDFGFILALFGINVTDKKLNPEKPKEDEPKP